MPVTAYYPREPFVRHLWPPTAPSAILNQLSTIYCTIPMPKSIRSRAEAARKEARELIAKNALPPYKELAKRWKYSMQMVAYILKTVRKEEHAAKRTAKRVVKHAPRAVKRAGKSHATIRRVQDALARTERDLHTAEQYIRAIPGLAGAEVTRLVKKSQAGVWSGLHEELLRATEAVGKLATIRGRRRRKSKKVGKS